MILSHSSSPSPLCHSFCQNYESGDFFSLFSESGMMKTHGYRFHIHVHVRKRASHLNCFKQNRDVSQPVCYSPLWVSLPIRTPCWERDEEYTYPWSRNPPFNDYRKWTDFKGVGFFAVGVMSLTGSSQNRVTMCHAWHHRQGLYKLCAMKPLCDDIKPQLHKLQNITAPSWLHWHKHLILLIYDSWNNE